MLISLHTCCLSVIHTRQQVKHEMNLYRLHKYLQCTLDGGKKTFSDHPDSKMDVYDWILRASDRDRDISLRFRYRHPGQINHMCPESDSHSGHMGFTCRRCPYLNLSEISLSRSKVKSIHCLRKVFHHHPTILDDHEKPFVTI